MTATEEGPRGQIDTDIAPVASVQNWVFNPFRTYGPHRETHYTQWFAPRYRNELARRTWGEYVSLKIFGKIVTPGEEMIAQKLVDALDIPVVRWMEENAQGAPTAPEVAASRENRSQSTRSFTPKSHNANALHLRLADGTTRVIRSKKPDLRPPPPPSSLDEVAPSDSSSERGSCESTPPAPVEFINRSALILKLAQTSHMRFGCMQRTLVNRRIVRDHVMAEMSKRSVPEHVQFDVVEEAVTLSFVHTGQEVAAANLLASYASERRDSRVGPRRRWNLFGSVLAPGFSRD